MNGLRSNNEMSKIIKNNVNTKLLLINRNFNLLLHSKITKTDLDKLIF